MRRLQLFWSSWQPHKLINDVHTNKYIDVGVKVGSGDGKGVETKHLYEVGSGDVISVDKVVKGVRCRVSVRVGDSIIRFDDSDVVYEVGTAD